LVTLSQIASPEEPIVIENGINLDMPCCDLHKTLEEDSQFECAHAVGPIFAIKEIVTNPNSNPNPHIIALPVVGAQ
jgi:hypothetical protein